MDNFDLYGIDDDELIDLVEAEAWDALVPGVDYELDRSERDWLTLDPDFDADY